MRHPLQLELVSALATLALALPLGAATQEAAPSQTTPEEVAHEVLVSESSALAELGAPERALLEESASNDQSHQFIRVLTSHFPRRMTGSSGIKLAQDWARTTFEDYGLDARLESWGEVEVGFDRGPASGRQLVPVEQELTFITPAWSPGTSGPARGAALLEPATLEEVEARADELRGAWIVRNPKLRGRKAREFNSAYTELGALGVIAPGARDGRLVTGGKWGVDYDDLPELVRVSLLYEQYAALLETLEAGEACELEFDIVNDFVHGPHTQYNVVADLRGSEFPDEYVLVQAHIDDWDGAQGACDNGTGVATTLEAARLLTRLDVRPRRTIRFVLYSGEEQGLYGSRGYVRSHASELEKISIVLNHDNGTHYLAGIAPTKAMLADFEQVFAPIQELDPERPFALRVSPGLTPGPSDHAPFIEAGVPAFHWNQSQEGYRHLHHTQFDTLEQVKPEDQRHSSLVVALAAWRFAQLDHLVDRTRMRQPSPRRMGVYLSEDDGRLVDNVMPGSKAAEAGWKAGDVILEIDGVEVSNRREVVAELQKGGPRKTVLLERGEEHIESVLDYSDDPMEKERAARREESRDSQE